LFCYKIYRDAEPRLGSAFYYLSIKISALAEHGKTGTIMKLHLISGAVLLYTLLTLAAICLAELGSTPQNVPF
jgi:hypothetical protein